MKFTKYYSSGQDLIYIEDQKAFDCLKNNGAKAMCNRLCGAGAEAIFTISKKQDKTSQIRGFCKNGEIMRDLSSASICAAFALFTNTGDMRIAFHNESSQFFTVHNENNSDIITVCGDMGKGDFNLRHPAINRRTQLGNRIITLSAVNFYGIHTVHFSDCIDSLNLSYLGEWTSQCSLFGKQADLTLAQQKGHNRFIISHFNKHGFLPSVSVLGSVALCACKTGLTAYNEEIIISVNNEDIFIVCERNENVTIQTQVRRVFSGDTELIIT